MPKIIKYLTENAWDLDIFGQKVPHSKSLFFLFSNFLGPVERSVVFFSIISFFLKRRQATRKSSHLVYLLKASERARYLIWSMRYFKLFASRLPPRSKKRERGPWQRDCIIVAASFQGFYAVGTKLSSAPLTEKSIYPSTNKREISRHKRTLCFLCRSSPFFFLIFQLPS